MDDAMSGRPCNSWEELCHFVGGSPSSFKGQLLTLIEKSDPGNRSRLRQEFPREVAAWETWCWRAPCTWGELERAIPAEASARTVTFDVTDPAVCHALTQSLSDYADRQQDMAAIGDIPEARLTWAAHAKLMLGQVEAAGS